MNTMAMMEILMNDSQQATFGSGGEEVLDEGCRHAKKLDRWQFTTKFHPADYGILDEIRGLTSNGDGEEGAS
jgi:hypothetical protein